MGELIFRLSICSWWQQWVGVATVVPIPYVAAKFDGMGLGMGVSRPGNDEKDVTYQSGDTHH